MSFYSRRALPARDKVIISAPTKATNHGMGLPEPAGRPRGTGHDPGPVHRASASSGTPPTAATPFRTGCQRPIVGAEPSRRGDNRVDEWSQGVTAGSGRELAC